MRKIHLLFALGAFAIATKPTVALAQDVTSTTVEVSENEQALRQEIVLPVPVTEAWKWFTDPAHVAKWMAPVAEVELRTGGSIRTNYDACNAVGDDGTITLNIVNFVPGEMLTLQAELDPQQRAKWMNDAIWERRERLYNVIAFEPVGEGQTKVTSWGLGYGTGEDWATIIGFFTAGNEWSYGNLRKAIAGEAVYKPCDGKVSEGADIVTETDQSSTNRSGLDPAAVFPEIAALVGRWEGTNEEGNPVAIEYSLTANDTAVVEKWFFHNGMQALTIYHPDGGQMMATHYCPIGNQPRLDLKRRKPDGTLEFEYVSATNLPDIDHAHEHAFDLQIIDANTIHRNETYRSDGELESNGTTFKRVG